MQTSMIQSLAALEARRLQGQAPAEPLPAPGRYAPFRRPVPDAELDHYVAALPHQPGPASDTDNDSTLVDAASSIGPRSSSSVMPSVWQLLRAWLRRLCGGGHDPAQGVG